MAQKGHVGRGSVPTQGQGSWPHPLWHTQQQQQQPFLGPREASLQQHGTMGVSERGERGGGGEGRREEEEEEGEKKESGRGGERVLPIQQSGEA